MGVRCGVLMIGFAGSVVVGVACTPAAPSPAATAKPAAPTEVAKPAARAEPVTQKPAAESKPSAESAFDRLVAMSKVEMEKLDGVGVGYDADAKENQPIAEAFLKEVP
jgi:hypothetical protein